MSPYAFAADNPIKLIDENGEGPGDPSVKVDGKTVIVTFTHKDVEYQLSFKKNKPQEFKLKNMKTGAKEKFDFYTNTTGDLITNKKSLALFKPAMKALETTGGAKDVKKIKSTLFGTEKVIDLLNSALSQNETFKIGIVGNVQVSEGTIDGKKAYNFGDHDKTDFNGFVRERAENVKKGYFGNKENVETYGINDVPAADKANLNLSPPNKDFTGATIYLKAEPSDKKTSVPSF